MLISPTYAQRKRLIENIEERFIKDNYNESQTLDYNDEKHCDFSCLDDKDNLFWFSPFAFIFKKKGYSALYHSLNLKKIYGDNRLAKLYKMGKSGRFFKQSEILDVLGTDQENSESVKLLIKNGFLILKDTDPYAPLKKMQNCNCLNKPHFGLLYLLITNDCNLRCRYCSIESFERKPESFKYSMMASETARRGIDLFLEILDRNAKPPRVIYYGGEPLLNWETLYDSLKYIREKENEGLFNEAKADVTIVCNGTLVTEEIVKSMKELSLTPSVSIDGLKNHHNEIRLFRNGRGSWEDSVKGYNLIRKHKGSCGISCTLGSHNIDDIEEIADFFATQLECRGMGFNIIKGVSHGNSALVPASIVTEQLIKAFRIFRRYGIYEDRVIRKVKSFVNETHWFHDCGGYGGQIAVCADGIIGPCHIAADARRFCWGFINEQNIGNCIKNSKLTADFCRRSPIVMEDCQSCVGLGICGGGCAEEAYVKNKSMFAMDEDFCIHCKMMIEWMIDDLAEKLKRSGELL